MDALIYTILTNVEDMLAHYGIVTQMPYSFDSATYAAYLEEMIPMGYRQMIVQEQGECIALAGYWINTKLYCGRYAELDNVIVTANHRDRGVGRLLCQQIEAEAIRQGCKTVLLDAYVENSKAHRFYFREGYIIRGYHFLKKL